MLQVCLHKCPTMCYMEIVFSYYFHYQYGDSSLTGTLQRWNGTLCGELTKEQLQGRCVMACTMTWMSLNSPVISIGHPITTHRHRTTRQRPSHFANQTDTGPQTTIRETKTMMQQVIFEYMIQETSQFLPTLPSTLCIFKVGAQYQVAFPKLNFGLRLDFGIKYINPKIKSKEKIQRQYQNR